MAEIKYTDFIPEKSPYAVALLNKTPRELANRYFQKKQPGPAQFRTPFLKEINKHDEQGILQNWRAYNMEGENLDHIYVELNRYVSLLHSMGYDYNYVNIVNDIDRLLGTDNKQILIIKKNPDKLSKYVEDIVNFYIHEILENRALEFIIPTQTTPSIEK